jgi:hypothetical protein
MLFFADSAGMVLGSYEMTLWALKSALRMDASDIEINRLIGEVYAESHNEGAARYYAKRAERLAAAKKPRKKKDEIDKVRELVDGIRKNFSGETPPPAAVVAKAAK